MKPKDVDSYISSSPKETKKMLRELRAIIRRAAPKAVEKISYGMPYYHLNGRLAYFRIAKGHLGLYIPPPILKNHAEDIRGYSWENATIRFPLDKKLPISLITKLVKARAKWNASKKRGF